MHPLVWAAGTTPTSAIGGLTEERIVAYETKGTKSSGYWRITEKGRLLCRGNLRVPRHILLYNQTILGHSKDDVSITEALGDRFNYRELLSANSVRSLGR